MLHGRLKPHTRALSPVYLSQGLDNFLKSEHVTMVMNISQAIGVYHAGGGRQLEGQDRYDDSGRSMKICPVWSASCGGSRGAAFFCVLNLKVAFKII